MENIVILGGGIAGTSAAEEIRKRNPDVAITIVEQEHHPLYSRVILPHYVKGKIPREKVFLKTWEWYEAQNIEIMPGVRILSIDTKNKFVSTSEGRELPFDVLIIAQGGELNVIGGEPRGVSYLRGVDDADELVALLRETKMRPVEEQHGVVYGGGFIALEYINIFAHFGIPCSVMMRGAGFWSSLMSEHSQKVLAKAAVDGGVKLYFNESEPVIVGEKQVEGVTLKDGTVLPCAILGVGIGLHQDKTFFVESGITIDHGVVVNEFLETEHEGVYGIGDGAQFFDFHVGRSVMYGNWMNAQMQGRAVAKTVCGERAVFDLVSSYATSLLGLHIVFIGDVDKKTAHEIKQVLATDVASVEEFYRDGKVVGAILVGDVSARASITARIKANGV